MKLVYTGLLLAALTGCDVQQQGGFVAVGGIQVNPVSDTVFEVIPTAGNARFDLWCGAGQYARSVLGASRNARLYVVSGPGPGVTADSRSAAQFSLLPPDQAQGAAGRSAGWGPQPGAVTTVQGASRACGERQSSSD